MKDQESKSYSFSTATVMPDGNGSYTPCPELMTEDELTRLLRIPEITKASNYGNVIANLKRIHNLPCIHICKKPLYPLNAVLTWVDEKMSKEKKR